jgi:hypothetical protein
MNYVETLKDTLTEAQEKDNLALTELIVCQMLKDVAAPDGAQLGAPANVPPPPSTPLLPNSTNTSTNASANTSATGTLLTPTLYPGFDRPVIAFC